MDHGCEQQAKRAGHLMTRHKRQRRQKEGSSTAANERLFHDPRDKTFPAACCARQLHAYQRTSSRASSSITVTGEMQQKHHVLLVKQRARPWLLFSPPILPKFHYAKRRFPVTSKYRQIDEIKN
jgi:hypothetical protein